MKSLVTQYHALNILDLVRGGYLYPFSKYDWVWRTNKGAHQTTVSITVLPDALELVFTMYGLAGVHQKVQLTYSIGSSRREASLVCLSHLSAPVGHAVSRERPTLSLSDVL